MVNNIFGSLLAKLPENNKLERIWILAKTDFKKRYYGTSLGVIWAVINPLFRLIIYYFVFSVLFKVEIENFALYLFLGLIIWMFFSESTKKSFTIFRSKQYVIQNIGINKLDLFISSLISVFMGFLFNFFVYLAVSIFFPVTYSFLILLLPLFIINILILIFAINLILAIINMYLRDLNHLWDMILLVLFWMSPIFYGREVIFKEYPIIGYTNPLAGIITNIREVVLYSRVPDWNIVMYDFGYSFVLLLIALIIFRKHSGKAIELL